MWLHYTDVELTKFRTLDISDLKDKYLFKPVGLWLSYNDEWMEWCANAEFYTSNIDTHHIYEVDLNNIFKDSINLIKITNIEEFEIFTKKYAHFSKEFRSQKIDWYQVMQDYDGLMVLNYYQIKHSIKLNMMNTWFFALDISCACIWNGTKVTFKELL